MNVLSSSCQGKIISDQENLKENDLMDLGIYLKFISFFSPFPFPFPF